MGIAGSGAIACGYAAYLASHGHDPVLWSPRGGRGEAADLPIEAVGALEAVCNPRLASDAAELAARSDVLILALPAFGHKAVIDALAPHLRPGQPVIISSHTAFGCLYLGNLLAARGVSAPIIAWSTTALTAKMPDPHTVRIGSIRSRIDMCTMPHVSSEAGHELCRSLFGDRFRVSDALAIALSNLNPQNHLAIALCNATRMDKGETWVQVENMTPMVARLVEALDAERLAIAETLSLAVRTVHQHFHLSYHIPELADLAAMFAEMQRRGLGGYGPATPDSRYVTEDVPFGLLPIILLGRLAGRDTVLHQAGLDIFSAMYGREFASDCDLMEALRLDRLTLAELRASMERGHTPDPA